MAECTGCRDLVAAALGSLNRQRQEKKISFLASMNGGEEFEGDKGSDLITCSWSDKASGTSLIDASSWWDKVAEGEASASGMAMSTEI